MNDSLFFFHNIVKEYEILLSVTVAMAQYIGRIV